MSTAPDAATQAVEGTKSTTRKKRTPKAKRKSFDVPSERFASGEVEGYSYKEHLPLKKEDFQSSLFYHRWQISNWESMIADTQSKIKAIEDFKTPVVQTAISTVFDSFGQAGKDAKAAKTLIDAEDGMSAEEKKAERNKLAQLLMEQAKELMEE